MKCLPFVFAAAALAPSLVYAQNQQFSDCRTLAAAGNFVGADEAIVDGLVCKVAKPKTNSATSPQSATKLEDRSMALLGIIEPEILRAKEKAGASAAGPAATPGVTSGPAPGDSLASGAPSASSSVMTPKPSLGEIARAYRKDAAARIAANSYEAEPVANSNTTQIAATVSQTASSPSAQVRPPARSPEPAATKKGTAKASGSAKSEVTAVPQTQLSPIRQEASPDIVAALHHESAAKPEKSSPPTGMSVSAPKTQPAAQTSILTAPQETPTRQLTASNPSSSATEKAPEPQPERLLSVGSIAVPLPAATNPAPQFEANNENEEDAAFREGQVPTCRKNVSLGSMDKDKLFLAIPDWALKWLEKNQRRFPGICFSDSLMPGAKNYLVVFYMAGSPAAGVGALKNVSGPGEMTSGSEMGSFTASYGSTWHYTYERTVTTTITSTSAEKAPHNQPSTLLYATAYSEQGIPVSHRSPASFTKQVKEMPHKAGKREDAELPEFHAMAGMLNQMVEDIAKP